VLHVLWRKSRKECCVGEEKFFIIFTLLEIIRETFGGAFGVRIKIHFRSLCWTGGECTCFVTRFSLLRANNFL
jgi:hypothetical protein